MTVVLQISMYLRCSHSISISYSECHMYQKVTDTNSNRIHDDELYVYVELDNEYVHVSVSHERPIFDGKRITISMLITNLLNSSWLDLHRLCMYVYYARTLISSF